LSSSNESTDLLFGILQILTENDETPADCATAVVNKDLSVYLQLQGALNADAEREKLRKKKDEIQKYVCSSRLHGPLFYSYRMVLVFVNMVGLLLYM